MLRQTGHLDAHRDERKMEEVVWWYNGEEDGKTDGRLRVCRREKLMMQMRQWHVVEVTLEGG